MEEYQDLDLYEILEIKKECSNDDIKKAYRRKAIKTHPDKASNDEERDQFKVEFQKIAFAYSILSDEKRRKRYDRTGSTEDIDLEESSLKDLFSSMCKSEITAELVEQDKKEYRESGEERDDILKYYKQGKGDLDVVFENVLHTDVLEDEKRITEIIQEAIDKGEVKAFNKFVKESKKDKQKRKRAAEKEAAEAEELAKELNIKSVGGGDELAMMIRKRHENTFNSLIDNLEQKYGNTQKAKKVKKSKIKV